MQEKARARGTEDRIMEAATRVFLRNGMAGARMARIAEEAGINKALLHYYFRSKEKLYRKVCYREVSRFFRDLISSIPPVEDIGELLTAIIDNYVDRLAGNPQIVRFLTWELGSGGPVAREVIADAIQGGTGPSVFSAYTRIVEASAARGEIRPVDPVHLVMSVLGMCLYPFLAAPILAYAFPGVQIDDPVFVEKRKTEIRTLVWNGIRAGGSDQDA